MCGLDRAEEASSHVRRCYYQPRPAFRPVGDHRAPVTQLKKHENRAAKAMIMQVRWRYKRSRLLAVHISMLQEE
jgi:hypothetical protein